MAMVAWRPQSAPKCRKRLLIMPSGHASMMESGAVPSGQLQWTKVHQHCVVCSACRLLGVGHMCGPSLHHLHVQLGYLESTTSWHLDGLNYFYFWRSLGFGDDAGGVGFQRILVLKELTCMIFIAKQRESRGLDFKGTEHDVSNLSNLSKWSGSESQAKK